MQSIHVLIQQIKENEERDIEFAKRIKQYETTVKTEEETIKHFQSFNSKLMDNLNEKLLETSKQEIKREILKHQKTIWDSMLKDNTKELKEEKVKLEAVQQSIWSDRVAFCDGGREFLDKYKLLDTPCGFVKLHYPPINQPKPIKKEQDTEEYNLLCDTVTNLEKELNDVNMEIAKTEELRVLKVQLNLEPSSGEEFKRLQNSIKAKKDEIENIESQIRSVRGKIAQVELSLLNKKKICSTVTRTKNMLQEQETKIQHVNKGNDIQNNSEGSDSNTAGNDSKIVKFKESVEAFHYSLSPRLKGILKTRTFKAKSPSSSLQKTLSRPLGTTLDEQIQDILFKQKR